MAITAIAPQPMFNSFPTPAFTYGSVPGDAATGFAIRDIVEKVDALLPYETEFLSWIPKKSARTQHRIDWLQDRLLPLEVTLGGSLTNNGTTLTLASGHTKYLQQWTVLLIESELVIINGPLDHANNTAPIIRAQGGTTGATHANGLVAKMVATAIPEETDFVFSPTSYGDWDYNYYERFQGGIAVDMAHDVLRDELYTNGNQLSHKLVKEAARQKALLNRALIYNKRQEGTPDPVTGNRRPGLMSGIPDLIRTNVTDMSGGGTPIKLSVGAFEESRENVRSKSNKLPEVYICSYKTKRIISRLIRSREATMAEDRISVVVNEIEFDSGVVKFLPIRDWPDNLIIGVRKEQCGLIPKKGLDWHERDIPVFGDHKKRTISGDFTCMLEQEETCEKYVGFDTNLANYPAVEFGRAVVMS